MIAATYAATWMHFLILLLLDLKVDKSSANFHKGSTQPVDDHSLDILILVSSNLWSTVFFIGKDHAFTPLFFLKVQELILTISRINKSLEYDIKFSN